MGIKKVSFSVSTVSSVLFIVATSSSSEIHTSSLTVGITASEAELVSILGTVSATFEASVIQGISCQIAVTPKKLKSISNKEKILNNCVEFDVFIMGF